MCVYECACVVRMCMRYACVCFAWVDQRVHPFYNYHNVSSRYIVIIELWWVVIYRVTEHLEFTTGFLLQILFLTDAKACDHVISRNGGIMQLFHSVISVNLAWIYHAPFFSF